MSELEPTPRFGGLDCPDGDVARLVVNGRPEIVAALDGLTFWAGDAQLIPIIRAGVASLARNLALLAENPEVEDGELIEELCSAAGRLQLAAKAYRRLVELKEDTDEGLASPYEQGYRAEVAELLHGPLPPFSLSAKERGVVTRSAKASLDRERGSSDALSSERIRELELLVEDAGDEDHPKDGIEIAALPRPRLFEWVKRWSAKTQDEPDRDDLVLLRALEGRCYAQLRERGL